MDHIIAIAQQLSKEGKVPTTALLKARLPQNTPLPAIIQGLQMWKETPDKEITPTKPTANAADNGNNSSLDALLDVKIRQAVAPLLARLDELEGKITTLQKQLTKEDKN
jgi:hypothetical protein